MLRQNKIPDKHQNKDLNAKSAVWGRDSTDSMEEELLDFVLAKGLAIINDSGQLVTFETENGRSWIDMTVTKQLQIEDWLVSDDESLSDYRYIYYWYTKTDGNRR